MLKKGSRLTLTMCPTMAVSQETNTTLLPVSLWRTRKARAYNRIWIPLVSYSLLPYPIIPTWEEEEEEKGKEEMVQEM